MKVFQTNLLLDKIIVFGSQGSDKIFNGNTRVGFPLTFQLFQLFVGGTDIESVENSPVCLLYTSYIANYEIGSDTFIENVDIILVDRLSTFGNGVEVAVLNETGGREVLMLSLIHI